VSKKEKAQIRVGSCAMLWALWNVRNDYIFNRTKQNSFMQVMPLDLYVVLNTINEQARGGGFLVQPPGVGCAGRIYTTSPAGVLI
jgi:hypothetical protein